MSGRFILRCVMLGGALLSLTTVRAEKPTDQSRTVAITAADPGTDSIGGKSLHALLELTALELQEQQGLELVERRQIDLTLQELLLQHGRQAGGSQPVELGRLATAEFLVGLKLIPPKKDDQRILAELRIVEARTGKVRGMTIGRCDETSLEDSARQFANYVSTVIRQPDRTTLTVAVAPFESLGRFDRLRPLELGIRDLITARLLEWNGVISGEEGTTGEEPSLPAFQVLQRSELIELIRELDFIQSGFADRSQLPETLPTRASSHLVRGTLDERTRDGGQELIVAGQLVSAATGRPVHEFRLECPPAELPTRLAAEVDRVVALMAKGNLIVPASPRRRERIETEPLLAETFQDLSRIHRLSPIDFAYRDVYIPPKLRLTGPRKAFVKADSDLGRHLLRKSIDRLESILYITPENALAALGLGFSYSFHLEGLYQPDRSAEMLHKAWALDRAGPVGANALGFLPEVTFHHRTTAPDRSADRQVAERAWFAYQNMPAAHRERRWPRLVGLMTSAYVRANDPRGLARVMSRAAELATRADDAERARLNSSAATMASTLALVARDDRALRDSAVSLLVNAVETDDLTLVQTAASGLARLAESEGDFLEAAGWYRKGAERLAECESAQNRQNYINFLMHTVRNYRQARRPREAFDLLTSIEPPRVSANLNRGQYGLELGSCCEDLGLPEQALAAYLTAAEECPGIIVNSDIVDRILRLGGVPLREDRDIEVRPVAGPKESPRPGYVLATDGRRVFVGRGHRSDRPEDGGVRVYDTTSGEWSRIGNHIGSVSALACDGHRLWAGTISQGLWRYDMADGAWTQWQVKEGLPDAHILAIALSEGVAYVSVGTPAAGGLVQIDADDRVRIFEDPLAPSSAPTHLVVTEDHLLARSHHVIHEYRFKTKGWTRQETGLAPDLFGGETGVWGSNYGQELFLYDADKETNRIFRAAWYPRGGQKAGYRLGFVAERGNDVWFGGNAWERFSSVGLYRLNRVTGEFVKYGPREGFDPRIHEIHDGLWIGDELWLATSLGLVVVEPR